MCGAGAQGDSGQTGLLPRCQCCSGDLLLPRAMLNPGLLPGFPGSLVVKNPPASAGGVRGVGSIHGSGRSPGVGHGDPLQYSCLKNVMIRRAWWVSVNRVTKSQTQLKQLSMHNNSWKYLGMFYKFRMHNVRQFFFFFFP